MNEVIINKKLSDKELIELTGQETSGDSVFLPKLRTNRDDVDDNGNEIPRGSYVITAPEHGDVYAKECKFRGFLNRYQYQHYSNAKNEYVNKSIVFINWNEEIYDELGGLRCGKAPAREAKALPTAEQEIQREIKCYRLLYGVLSMEGVTATGEKVSIENLPALWRTTGSNWEPVKTALDGLTKSGRAMIRHDLLLSLTRAKQGSNVYFPSVIKVDDKVHDLTDDDIETLRIFTDIIHRENQEVIARYDNSKKSVRELNDDIGDLFNTEENILQAG